MQIAGTYSILAIDRRTGEIGAAVQSHWFHVADVLWSTSGVGAVATQSIASFDYGPRLLARLERGEPAAAALARELREDENRDVRQIAVLTPTSHAVHTGARCIAHAGHHAHDDHCVAANLMARPTVWDAMSRAFETCSGTLSERMMAALEAAQAEGGDLRGMQSCAMKIVRGESTGHHWKDKVLDVRVDDHPDPLGEMRRSLAVARAYDHMVRGEQLLGERRLEDALAEHEEALALAPSRAEIKFWTAVGHVAAGDVDVALGLFRRCFAQDEAWRTLVDRLVEPGLLPDDEELLTRIREA